MMAKIHRLKAQTMTINLKLKTTINKIQIMKKVYLSLLLCDVLFTSFSQNYTL